MAAMFEAVVEIPLHDPLVSLYSHVPCEAEAVLETTATPAKVFAELPPDTVSKLSLKLAPNKLDTVAPVGAEVSSLTVASVAEPLATGVSLTAVMLMVAEPLAVLLAVAPSLTEMERVFVPLKFNAPW